MRTAHACFFLTATLALGGCFSAGKSERFEASTGDATEAGTTGGEASDSTGVPDVSTSGPTDGTTEPPTDPASTQDGSGTSSSGTSADPSTNTDTGQSESSSGPGPATVCPTFLDTFDLDKIGPLWLQNSPESLSQQNGEAVINVTAALNDQFARLQVFPENNGLAGATARIEIGTPPADDGILLILWVEPLNHDGRIGFNLAHHGTDGILLEARITPEVGPPQIVDTAPWDPQTMQWLQLREEDDMLYFESSEDGSIFGTVFEMTTPFDMSTTYVGFVGHNNLPMQQDVQVSVRTFEFLCGS